MIHHYIKGDDILDPPSPTQYMPLKSVKSVGPSSLKSTQYAKIQDSGRLSLATMSSSWITLNPEVPKGDWRLLLYEPAASELFVISKCGGESAVS